MSGLILILWSRGYHANSINILFFKRKKKKKNITITNTSQTRTTAAHISKTSAHQSGIEHVSFRSVTRLVGRGLGLGPRLRSFWLGNHATALRFWIVCSARQNNGPSSISETLIREDGFGEILKCRLGTLVVDFQGDISSYSTGTNVGSIYFKFGNWNFKWTFGRHRLSELLKFFNNASLLMNSSVVTNSSLFAVQFKTVLYIKE